MQATPKWEKVDSHIRDRVYKPGQKPKGNAMSFCLNEMADELAGDKRALMTTSPPEIFFPASKIMIECSGEFIYGKVSTRITKIITSPSLQEYLQDKNKWDTQTFNSIDWKAMGAFMKSLTGEQETNVIKLVHNWQNDRHQGNTRVPSMWKV